MLSALKGIMNQEYQLYVMPKKISMPVRFVFFLLIVEFCKVELQYSFFYGYASDSFPKHAGHLVTVAGLVEKKLQSKLQNRATQEGDGHKKGSYACCLKTT